MKKLLKKLLSAFLCIGLSAVCLNVTGFAESGFCILADGVEIPEFSASVFDYEYSVASLDRLPVLSLNGDIEALIEQPSRENDYTGRIKVKTGDIYTVRFTDGNDFQSHFINVGGDPYVTYKDGWYYYMVTGNGFNISRSRDLSRVNSNPVTVFTIAELTSSLGFSVSELWAPELHFYGGNWYIYFTVYDNTTASKAKNHRMYVLKSDSADALGSYTCMGQICEVESDYANDTRADDLKAGHFAIDGSFLSYNGKMYFIWSGWNAYDNVSQRIYIAEMSDPCTISSARAELSLPQYDFETYSTSPSVNEGPQAIVAPDGTLNILYSANLFTDSHYSLGCLTLREGGNPLNKDDWKKSDKALFETNGENSTYSVGHASMVPSPDQSEYYLIYHARHSASSDANREIRVQKFYFCDDGTPCFTKALSATDKVRLPSGTPIFEKKLIEAEDMNLNGAAVKGASEKNTADYFSGGKYTVFSSGSFATFNVNVESAGNYTVSLYAAGASNGGAYGLKVTANGNSYLVKTAGNASSLNFFHYDITGVSLKEGDNEIEIAFDSSFNKGANLDKVEIWNEQEEAAAVTSAVEKWADAPSPLIFKKGEEEFAFYKPEYKFNSFSDFDKYWFSTTPFVSEYDNTITTVRPGGNKRLTVSDPTLQDLQDFTASVEITPSDAHIYGTDTQVKPETALNSGIIFRAANLGCGGASDCAFDGYRCILVNPSGDPTHLKLQFHVYAYGTGTASKGTVLSTSTGMIDNVAGHTYVLTVTASGSVASASVYDTKDPDTVLSLTNVNLYAKTSKFYSGKIGLFANTGTGRVTFSNMTVKPDMNVPTGISKKLGSGNAADFSANTKIKITNSTSAVQTGFCFRVSEVAQGVSPGLTGYAIFIQRSSSYTPDKLNVNLTKYGTDSSGAKNVNLGNQSFADTGNLLGDCASNSDVVGKEFLFKVKVTGNKLTVDLNRCDKPSLTYHKEWTIDSADYSVNKTYPVYYKDGAFGLFSNGVAEVSGLTVNKIDAKTGISLSAQNGRVFADSASYIKGDKAVITAVADKGYYIAENAEFTKRNALLDKEAVFETEFTDKNYSITFNKVLLGDTNTDKAVDLLDLVRFKKYFVNDGEKIGFSNSDMNESGTLDADDLCRLKQELLKLKRSGE